MKRIKVSKDSVECRCFFFFLDAFSDPVNVSFISADVNVVVTSEACCNWFARTEFFVLFSFILQHFYQLGHSNAFFAKDKHFSIVKQKKLCRNIIVGILYDWTEASFIGTAVKTVLQNKELLESFPFCPFEGINIDGKWLYWRQINFIFKFHSRKQWVFKFQAFCFF